MLVPCMVSFAQSVFDGPYGKKIHNFPKETILEQPQIEYIYYHLTCDPLINESREDYEILMVGKSYILFKDYGRYQLDSLFQHRDKRKVTNKEYHDEFWRNKKGSTSTYILKSLKDKNMWVYDRISPDTYYYEENTPDFHWKLEDGTRTVCGHTCQKATCSFHGRDWTAWYAMDIPQSQGPWKFSGLPGLIMLVEDSKREHIFKIVSIRKGSKDCMISRMEAEWDFRTNREWFVKTQKRMMEDPLGYIQSTGVILQSPDGKSNKLPRRPFFNPIEKE